MKFGEVPLAEAHGTILAHSVPHAALSKGITLGAGHLASLQAIGHKTVTVAQLEDEDVGEDEAAMALAKALVPDAEAQGVRLSKASKGRVNVMSMRAGLVQLDANRINALNRIDPMITIATLPDLTRVVAGVMLATIKIISYGVAKTNLDAACAVVAAPFALRLRTAVLTKASLIETKHPGTKAQPKGRRVLEERMDRLGCDLVETIDVPHEQSAISGAIIRALGEVVFILTASATSDANDVAPTALIAAGGRMDHFGMPVDPGNLLFIGAHTDRPVIGLPGCARSPALNGADWVIERVMCGLPVGADQISAMGVGGLLKEIPERGRARG